MDAREYEMLGDADPGDPATYPSPEYDAWLLKVAVQRFAVLAPDRFTTATVEELTDACTLLAMKLRMVDIFRKERNEQKDGRAA